MKYTQKVFTENIYIKLEKKSRPTLKTELHVSFGKAAKID